MHVRTRIAPSPTGALHIGTARTALFNYLFSKHEKGEFLLRIEDTDLERSDKKFENDIIDGLKWLGIDWDGEITRQSERLNIYEKYLNQLLESGDAFYCPHSEEALEAERKEQMSSKISPKHVCEFRGLPAGKAGERLDIGSEKSKNGIIRFKNNATQLITFFDEIRGEISFDPKLLGDFSLAKNTRTPLYNFAVVIDDAEMEISHVIRGEDHIPNTPKQILLQDALGFPRPKYAHLPLILGQDRSKLSKRHGATSVNEYRDAGYLPEALFNFMALLGWRPEGSGEGSEIFSKEELIRAFSLEKIQKAGAIFDIQKLDWMNGEYIRRKSPRELLELVTSHLGDLINQQSQFPISNSQFPNDYLAKIIGLEQPRLKKLSELHEKVDYFFKEPEYDVSLLKWKNMTNDEIKKSLGISKNLLENFFEENITPDLTFPLRKGEGEESLSSTPPPYEGGGERGRGFNNFTKTNLEKIFMTYAGNLPAGKAGDRGELLWPLRVALSGKKASPGPFEIMEILGKEKSQARIEYAINMLK